MLLNNFRLLALIMVYKPQIGFTVKRENLAHTYVSAKTSAYILEQIHFSTHT